MNRKTRRIKIRIKPKVGNVFDRKKEFEQEAILAVRSGDLEKLKSLLGKIDVNTVDECGNSLLHLAVRSKNANIAKFLLMHNANPNKQNMFGVTPLHEASNNWDRKIISLLMEHGANPKVKDKFGRAAL